MNTEGYTKDQLQQKYPGLVDAYTVAEIQEMKQEVNKERFRTGQKLTKALNSRAQDLGYDNWTILVELNDPEAHAKREKRVVRMVSCPLCLGGSNHWGTDPCYCCDGRGKVEVQRAKKMFPEWVEPS